MKVEIKETGKTVELTILSNGINWVADLIGNAGATTDGQFVWDSEKDCYIATQETVDWWTKYINESNTTDADVEKMAEELNISESEIRERISENTDGDYNYHRKQAIAAMNEIRAEHGK